MARLPYADDEALPDDYDIVHEQEDTLAEEIDAEWWNSQPTVRTFANSPDLAQTHVTANVSMWTQTGLSSAEVEYVILAVSREMDSAYEWHDHVFAALDRAGMNREEVLAISERDTTEMEPSKRALVEYAFDFVREYGEVTDEKFEQLTEHYDDGTVMGITMLAGYYVWLHHVTAAVQLELEEEFVGWQLENY
jgi:alkylhydroperoxidase family enzyme